MLSSLFKIVAKLDSQKFYRQQGDDDEAMETLQDEETVSSTTSEVLSASQKTLVTGLKVMFNLETPQ